MTPHQRARARVLCDMHPRRPELDEVNDEFCLVDPDDNTILWSDDGSRQLAFDTAEALLFHLETAALAAGRELPSDPPTCVAHPDRPAVCYGAESGDHAVFCCAECASLTDDDLAAMVPGELERLECGWLVVLPPAEPRPTPAPPSNVVRLADRRPAPACPHCGASKEGAP